MEESNESTIPAAQPTVESLDTEILLIREQSRSTEIISRAIADEACSQDPRAPS